MTTPALLLSRLSFAGFAKEVTQGVYVAPTLYLPGEKYAMEDMPTYDEDTSMEGNAYKLQAVIQGVKDSQVGIDAKCYFEILGLLFVACGYADTVSVGRSVADSVTNGTTTVTSATAVFIAGDVGATVTGTNIPVGSTIATVVNGTTITIGPNVASGSGSGGSLVIAGGATHYQHKFKMPAAGTQPPSYSVTDFNQLTASTGTRGYVGQMLDQLDLTIDVKALIKLATQWKGWPSASQSKPTPAYPVIKPGHGWQSSYTVAGAALVGGILSAQYTLKQNVETVHTGQNSQSPWVTFSGEKEAALKLKVAPQDETEMAYYLNNTQPTFVTKVTSPSGTVPPILTLTSTVSAWKKGPLDRTGKYETVPFDIDLVGNSTDGGPLQIMLENGVSSQY